MITEQTIFNNNGTINVKNLVGVLNQLETEHKKLVDEIKKLKEREVKP